MVLDATVLVDLLRGVPAALDFMTALTAVPLASEVTRVEVHRGLRSGERREYEDLCRTIRWVPVDEPVARRAGEHGRRYRASHEGAGIADLIVAATADHVGLPLATHNVRHFPMFDDLAPPY